MKLATMLLWLPLPLLAGSPVITLSALTMASDGVTITAALGAGTAPYSITDCTGLSYKIGGAAKSLPLTCAVSGGTLTMLLPNTYPAYADPQQTLTLGIASGSNLTDSAGNSAAPQSGLTITNTSTWYGPSLAPFTGSSRVDGAGWSNNSNQPGGLVWQSGGAGIRFNATMGSTADIRYRQRKLPDRPHFSINAVVFQYGTTWQLLQDGVQIGSVAVMADHPTTWAQTSSVTTWSEGITAGTHTYTLQQVGTTLGSTGVGQPRQVSLLSAIQIVGGKLTGVQPPATTFLGVCGDSIIDLHQLSYSIQGFFNIAATSLGMASQYQGNSGWCVSNGAACGSAGPLATYCPSSAGLGFQGGAPDITILNGSGNDIAHLIPVGSPGDGNSDVAGAAYNDILSTSTWNAGSGAVKKAILYQGVLPNATRDQSTAAAYDAGLAAAMAAYNHGTPAVPGCFYRTLNWITNNTACIPTPSPYDGAHPSAVCEIVMANNLIPILAGYESGSSYTISGGATTGTVGAATPAFTVTLPGGATFAPGSGTLTGSFTMPVTISSSVSGDTITSSVGIPQTGSVTVTETTGSTFTFTLTPSSAGPRTISSSSGPDCWTNPPSLTFTASAPAGNNN